MSLHLLGRHPVPVRRLPEPLLLKQGRNPGRPLERSTEFWLATRKGDTRIVMELFGKGMTFLLEASL